MFQEKISRTATRRLQAVRFDVAQLEIEEIFKAATSLVKPAGPLIGPNLSSAILQRQRDYIQSVSTFFHAIKVRLSSCLCKMHRLTLIVCSYEPFLREPSQYLLESSNSAERAPE